MANQRVENAVVGPPLGDLAASRQAGEVTVGKAPGIEPSMPYTDFVEVTDQKRGRGFGEIAWDSTKWLLREAIMPALEKLIPQGAQELANGLFTGNPYWPGGETQEPVPMQNEVEGGIHGPAPVEPSPNYPEVAAYEAVVAEYAQRHQPDNDRGITR